MFSSIVARTFELARRWWVRIAISTLIASIVAVVVVGALLLDTFADAFGPDPDGVGGKLVVLLCVAAIINVWAQMVPIRAASGRHGIGASLLGAVVPALRAIPLLLLVVVLQVIALFMGENGVYVALVLALLLVVPLLSAVGDLALEPNSWGMRAFFLRGLGRLPRNLPVYAASLVVLAGAIAFAVAWTSLALLIATGHVDPARADDAGLLGALLQLPGSFGALVLVACLAVAVHETLYDATTRTWDGDDDEPYVPTSEISPAVQQLIGTAQPSRRRLRIPPRADVAGRVPGPGVLSVAGVDLPAGRAARPVQAATLELAVGDGAPGAERGDEQLWVSREVHPRSAERWKQLAAGFAETGLWPLLLPDPGADSTMAASSVWYEQSARREPDAFDGVVNVAERFRARLAESLAGGSPLSSTGLLATSRTAHGQLGLGTSRRTDALGLAFELLGPSRLGLAAARHPGDIVHGLAWPAVVAAGIPSQELAALIGSWEERYGALLVGIDATTLTFAVLRPPATIEEAIELAAEQHALCPDQAIDWGDDQSAAQALVDTPTWQLSWR